VVTQFASQLSASAATAAAEAAAGAAAITTASAVGGCATAGKEAFVHTYIYRHIHTYKPIKRVLALGRKNLWPLSVADKEHL